MANMLIRLATSDPVKVLIPTLLLGLLGCAPLREAKDSAILMRAAHAAYRELPKDREWGYSRDYAKGWKRGYVVVADGGPPTLPPVAPQCYWGHKWQSREGQRRIDDWYRGYTEGAARAARGRWGQFSYVPSPYFPEHVSETSTEVHAIPELLHAPAVGPLPIPDAPEPDAVIGAAWNEDQSGVVRLPPISDDGLSDRERISNDSNVRRISHFQDETLYR